MKLLKWFQDDGSRDYAIGYVVIIQKLMHLDAKISTNYSVMLDVKNMIIDLGHTVSKLNDTVATLRDENIQLKVKIQEISEKQDTVVTATSVYGKDVDDIVESQSSSSTHTRQVSSTVPACVIRSFWQKHHSGKDMEVEIKYLRSVCESIFPKLQPKVKSDLGILLSKYIDNYEHNSNGGNYMMMVLCGNQNLTLSEGRTAIIKTMKSIGTKYAFMVPRKMALLLSRTESIYENVSVHNGYDHTLMPGVVCGDIGPKIGLNNMDNGFARFDNVVILRRNMAMRFPTVDEQGTYQKKVLSDAASNVSYITMMQVRAYIIHESYKNLAMGCTMAIRYPAVRKQGYASDNIREMQILDYK